MRTALISLAGQPRTASGDAPLVLAGKTIARRQLDFALAAGCEAVIVLGDGAAAEAIAMRHAAESEGARFQAIRDGHGLLRAVRADDDLLVLAPGLLPEANEAVEALAKGRRVLVLPAGSAVSAGFERIDLNRAWAGALLVGGAQVDRLSDLPADIDPASALVRIALQANVRETPLSEDLLTDGTWRMFGERADPVASDRVWLNRHAPAASVFAPTRWLGQLALQAAAGRVLAARHSTGGLLAATLTILVGAVLLARYGWSWPSFALIAVGALLTYLVAEIVRLRSAPFGGPTTSEAVRKVLPWIVDGAILACAVLAIDGAWLHRIFPPLVLMGLLRAVRPEMGEDSTAIVGDRGFLALVLAIAAGFGVIEAVVMLLSLILIALNLAQAGARSG